jgi:cell division transport system ATP-binding protein
MIELHRVWKVYAVGPVKVPALSDVSFRVSKGEFVTLCGPSGAGKTTLLRLLYRDEVPSEGEVEVLRQEVSSLSRREVAALRRSIGIVFQDSKLLPGRTVYENVAFVLRVLGTPRREITGRVFDALRAVGLSARAQAYPAQLSQGEAQRAALARAIARKPLLLIADEPTGNLDEGMAAEVIEIVRDINAGGTTVLFATHQAALAPPSSSARSRSRTDAWSRTRARAPCSASSSEKPCGTFGAPAAWRSARSCSSPVAGRARRLLAAVLQHERGRHAVPRAREAHRLPQARALAAEANAWWSACGACPACAAVRYVGKAEALGDPEGRCSARTPRSPTRCRRIRCPPRSRSRPPPRRHAGRRPRAGRAPRALPETDEIGRRRDWIERFAQGQRCSWASASASAPCSARRPHGDDRHHAGAARAA